MIPDWQSSDGSIRLYCGDCLQILPELEAGSVDAVVTDPPYGIAYKHGKCRATLRGLQPCRDKERWGAKLTEGRTIHGDNKPFNPAPWLMWPCVLWGANHYHKAMPEGGTWLCWNKAGDLRFNDSCVDAEFAWTSAARVKRNVWNHLWKGMVKWRSEEDDESRNPVRLHVMQKPVALMRWCAEMVSQAGDSVLDPFMGSGTTGVACVRTGRKFIGIELEPKYFEIAKQRIQRALDDKAEMLPIAS